MKLLLYDGTCNFCHWAVQWIKKHANASEFQFEALDSTFGKQFFEKYPELKKVDSIIFLDSTGIYIKSQAVFAISKYLHKPWPLLQLFKIFPTFFCDAVYSLVARNRKKWFGSQNSCEL